jgi:hypothetical protein
MFGVVGVENLQVFNEDKLLRWFGIFLRRPVMRDTAIWKTVEVDIFNRE